MSSSARLNATTNASTNPTTYGLDSTTKVQSTGPTTSIYIVVPPIDIYAGEFEKLKAKVEKLDDKGGIPVSNPMSFKTYVPISKYFKMPVVNTFDGTGFPETHLSFYATIIKTKWGHEKLVAHFFKLSLVDFAPLWYVQQENQYTQTWENLCKPFVKQYKCNVQVEATRSDLKAMKQGPKEFFLTMLLGGGRKFRK